MLDRQDDFAEAWKRVFGGQTPHLSLEFHEWIKGHAQPWRIVWVSWQQRGANIGGESWTSSLAVLKETPKTLTAEVQSSATAGAAGLVFGYQSVNDFYLLQVRPGNKVNVCRRLNGVWVQVAKDDLQPGKDRSVLSVSQDDKSSTLWANGKKVIAIPVVGQVGLNVEGSRALFHIVSPAAPGA